MILAAIDIGSNAARLLITEVIDEDGGKPQFNKINLVRVPLRLGFDVFAKGEISKEPCSRKFLIQNCCIVPTWPMKFYAGTKNHWLFLRLHFVGPPVIRMTGSTIRVTVR